MNNSYQPYQPKQSQPPPPYPQPRQYPPPPYPQLPQYPPPPYPQPRLYQQPLRQPPPPPQSSKIPLQQSKNQVSSEDIKNYLEFIGELQKEYGEYKSIEKGLILLKKWLHRYQNDITNLNLKKEGFYLLFHLFSILIIYIKFFKEDPIYYPFLTKYNKLFDLLFRDRRWILEHLYKEINEKNEKNEKCVDLKMNSIRYYLNQKYY